jgi:hypothetical protein
MPPPSIEHSNCIDIDAVLHSGGNIATFVNELAARYGVTFIANDLDIFAAAVSRLSDAEVQPDATEDLLIVLQRAGIISSSEGMVLHHAHIRQLAR